MLLGVRARETPVRLVELVLVELTSVGSGDSGVGEDIGAVPLPHRDQATAQPRVALGAEVIERRLGEHHEVVRAAQAVSECEVMLGEVSALLLFGREIAVLVVPLEQRDP